MEDHAWRVLCVPTGAFGGASSRILHAVLYAFGLGGLLQCDVVLRGQWPGGDDRRQRLDANIDHHDREPVDSFHRGGGGGNGGGNDGREFVYDGPGDGWAVQHIRGVVRRSTCRFSRWAELGQCSRRCRRRDGDGDGDPDWDGHRRRCSRHWRLIARCKNKGRFGALYF